MRKYGRFRGIVGQEKHASAQFARLGMSCKQLPGGSDSDLIVFYTVPLCNHRNIDGRLNRKGGYFDCIALDIFALFEYDFYISLRFALGNIFVECHVDSVLWGGRDLPPPDWITVFADYLISVSVT